MSDTPTLTFLGATGTVTGSKYLLEANGDRLLVDCGLFQGKKALRQRHWQPLPVEAASLDAVLLTHAHLDHGGYLPMLRKQGFNGPVFCTSGTAALARILLTDAGHLHEEDARYAERKGYSRHRPAKPLYTQAEAEASLGTLRPVAFREPVCWLKASPPHFILPDTFLARPRLSCASTGAASLSAATSAGLWTPS